MKELKPPHDPIEALGQAYELLLEKSMDEARQAEQRGAPRLGQIIDRARHEVAELTRLSEAQGLKLADYLKRDLEDAARFLSVTGKELKEWWGFESTVLEEQLLENFTQAADRTTVELQALNRAAETAEYRTGEITGPGTLECDGCGELLHFHGPGRIPPCPRCHKSRFHRERTG